MRGVRLALVRGGERAGEGGSAGGRRERGRGWGGGEGDGDGDGDGAARSKENEERVCVMDARRRLSTGAARGRRRR